MPTCRTSAPTRCRRRPDQRLPNDAGGVTALHVGRTVVVGASVGVGVNAHGFSVLCAIARAATHGLASSSMPSSTTRAMTAKEHLVPVKEANASDAAFETCAAPNWLAESGPARSPWPRTSPTMPDSCRVARRRPRVDSGVAARASNRSRSR